MKSSRHRQSSCQAQVVGAASYLSRTPGSSPTLQSVAPNSAWELLYPDVEDPHSNPAPPPPLHHTSTSQTLRPGLRSCVSSDRTPYRNLPTSIKRRDSAVPKPARVRRRLRVPKMQPLHPRCQPVSLSQIIDSVHHACTARCHLISPSSSAHM
jgi:hypothetical protein